MPRIEIQGRELRGRFAPEARPVFPRTYFPIVERVPEPAPEAAPEPVPVAVPGPTGTAVYKRGYADPTGTAAALVVRDRGL